MGASINMNLFKITRMPGDEELVEQLIPDHGTGIERIISCGHSSPAGFWYNQERDEWVALLQGEAEISWKSGRSLVMKAGDWIFIPAGEEHRIEWTSEKPPCIWLAIHGNMGSGFNGQKEPGSSK